MRFHRRRKTRSVTTHVREIDLRAARLRRELADARNLEKHPEPDFDRLRELDEQIGDVQLELIAALLIDPDGKPRPAEFFGEHVDMIDDLGDLADWAVGNEPDPTPTRASPDESTSS